MPLNLSRSYLCCVLTAAFSLLIVSPQGSAQQSGPAGGSPLGQPNSTQNNPGGQTTAIGDRLPESLFLRLDRNHDKSLSRDEVSAPDAAPYAARLANADRDGNERITLEEFNRVDEVPLYRDPRTAAAILLILAFGAYCVFLDGLFDPDHRDFFWISVGAMAGCAGLAYFVGRAWYLDSPPYLGYVAVAPVLLIVAAVLFKATREKEEAAADPTGPVVYQVGKKPAADEGVAKSGPVRRSPPVRTPRPPPMSRPAVPERRPQSQNPPGPKPPPRPNPPPRPPGSRPPGGPKPPPGKS